MLCSACNASNRDDARFCVSCGVPLGRLEEDQPDPYRAHGTDTVSVPIGAIVAIVAVVIVGVVAFFAFRGGDPDGAISGSYPPEVRANFISSCTSQGAPEATCVCMLDAIEDRISLEEFRRLEASITSPDALPPAFVEAITGCF